MNQPPVDPPKTREVTINGALYELIAFYFPDRDTAWDTIYQGQFLANFYTLQDYSDYKWHHWFFLHRRGSFSSH